MTSFVLPSTSVLASTTPVVWSAAAKTCRASVSLVREPRNVLPSTAIARRVPAGGAGSCVASQAPITMASRS
ncbi:hypothetical protein, partial [Micromonospora coerulea]|uniref:hypothetical protein n=1 Tax=Micromonospora coerulea TaxID=47856 RepID=UPI0031F7E2B9